MTITAELADGRTLEFPDGTDPSVVQQTVKRLIAPAKPPAPLTKDTPNPIDEFLIGKLSAAPGLGNAPDIQGSIPGRVIQGMADMPLGALQLGANALGMGGAINKRIKEINDRTQALRGGPEAGFDWARLAGNLANPATLMAVGKIPIAAGYLGKVGQGALVGGVAGATAPIENGGENFASEKAAQIGAGALIGGLIPAVTTPISSLAKTAYRGFIEPRFNPAVTRGRVYLEAAGDKADEVVNALKNAKEIVPGSMPTAGEAAVPAGSAEFSALQKQASEIAPSAYVGRTDAQNAARLASLRTVGKTSKALDDAVTARGVEATKNYGAVSNQLVEIDQQLRDILTNPILQPAVKRAATLSAGRGMPVMPKSNKMKVGQLQDLKMAMDDVINNPETFGIGASEANLVGTLKNKLVNILVEKSPGWEKARSTFAEQSKPINQMQIGQYLEKKLVPALSEDAKQKAATYAAAVQDAAGTIKRSTGVPRYDDLTKVLTPDQMQVVNGIRDDLARGARFTDLARAGAKAASDIGSPAGKQRITGMFSREVTIANEIIGRLEGKVNKRIAAEIAVEMLNPTATAKTLAEASARAARNKATASMVEKAIRSGTAVGVNASERQ